MKFAELAARNVRRGYRIAAGDPVAAEHVLTGRLDLRPGAPAAALSDDAAASAGLRTDGLGRTAVGCCAAMRVYAFFSPPIDST
ncbi:hypothetical protein [Catellatospora paridis]|uniref:hypothetical protein n=1 Tax=Catellatospora paridis TaxID=1617086 RepID=UPI0012D3A4D2|nr:hypothetical protein [Catellatospora paridis]